MSLKKIKVAIVILHYGEQEHTIKCIESVCEASLFSKRICSTELYVVDNGTDSYWEADLPLSRSSERITIIKSATNVGFAAGMNIGITAALSRDPTYFWLLNNDTSVETASIQNLVNYAAQHPTLKWIGCEVSYDQPARNRNILGYKYSAFLSSARPVRDANEKPDYLDGAATFICAKTLQEIGGLPERSFLYFEELHLASALRLRGLSWGVCKDAKIHHINGGSAASMPAEIKSYHLTSAALRYTLDHAGFLIVSVWLVRGLKATLDSASQCNIGPLRGFLRATLHLARNRY